MIKLYFTILWGKIEFKTRSKDRVLSTFKRYSCKSLKCKFAHFATKTDRSRIYVKIKSKGEIKIHPLIKSKGKGNQLLYNPI